MEDALARKTKKEFKKKIQKVLILVLMEDALVPSLSFVSSFLGGLNPCFNGRSTRTERNLVFISLFRS